MYLLNTLNIINIQQAGWFGGYEIILIVVIILLLFGGKKIPELMRGIGKGVKEFKSGISEEDDVKDKNSGVESSGAKKK